MNADLHDAIMRLQCYASSVPELRSNLDMQLAFKMGHRDARHAAAELVLAALTVDLTGLSPDSEYNKAIEGERA